MSRPVEADLAGGGVEQAHDQPRGGALAAAGLADEPERLAAPSTSKLTPSTASTAPTRRWKSDAAGEREVLDEVAHLHQRLPG